MTEDSPTSRRVRFGEVVRLVKETCKDPVAAGIERVIGLEHLEPGDLRVRTWAQVADGTTFTTRVRPGQVLFGKRRAYQRKVAVAEFDALCSGDIYVFESVNPTRLLPELLPFICQTDAFFHHAVGTSAGSLSPRTKWSSLAGYEFALPPLEAQERMLRVLSAARDVGDSMTVAAAAADRLFAGTLEHLFSRGVHDAEPVRVKYLSYPPTWRVLPLEDLARVERGMFSHRPRNLPEFFGGPYPFAQTGDVAASRGALAAASQRLSELGKTYSKAFPAGSVLITIAAVIGATAITTEDTWCPDSVVGIVPRTSEVDVQFLEFALRRLRPFLEFHEATQTAQKNINLQNLRPLLIAIPSRDEQERIVGQLLAIETQIENLERRKRAARGLGALVASDLMRGEA